jgi:hypothetical protein
VTVAAKPEEFGLILKADPIGHVQLGKVRFERSVSSRFRRKGAAGNCKLREAFRRGCRPDQLEVRGSRWGFQACHIESEDAGLAGEGRRLESGG